MNWLVFHIVSGQAFFSGVVLFIGAALASLSSRSLYRRLGTLGFRVGLIAIVLSSTAIPYWFYAIACVVSLGWLVLRFKPQWRTKSAISMIAVWLVASLIELPNHWIQPLSPAKSRAVTIIGDSLTAGVDDGSETWPRLLARRHDIAVQDISHVGETVSSAFKRISSQEIDSPIVILEIGGNDILGSTTSAQFARDLEALLAHLEAPNRQLVMFELPLPPLYHEFGRIQRTLAARHNVTLIPKRALLSVIAGSESTLDSIHLTQAGHQRMANQVWAVLQSAFEPAKD